MDVSRVLPSADAVARAATAQMHELERKMQQLRNLEGQHMEEQRRLEEKLDREMRRQMSAEERHARLMAELKRKKSVLDRRTAGVEGAQEHARARAEADARAREAREAARQQTLAEAREAAAWELRARAAEREALLAANREKAEEEAEARREALQFKAAARSERGQYLAYLAKTRHVLARKQGFDLDEHRRQAAAKAEALRAEKAAEARRSAEAGEARVAALHDERRMAMAAKSQELRLRQAELREKALQRAYDQQAQRAEREAALEDKRRKTEALEARRAQLMGDMLVRRRELEAIQKAVTQGLRASTEGGGMHMHMGAGSPVLHGTRGAYSSRPGSAGASGLRVSGSNPRRPASATPGGSARRALYADGAGGPDERIEYRRGLAIPPSAIDRQLEMLLVSEQGKETERQSILRVVSDPTERERLGRVFASERQKAKEAIMALQAKLEASTNAQPFWAA